MLFSPLGKVKSAAISTLQGATLPIAIDFGASALKVLQLQSGDTPQLIAAACIQTPYQLIDDPAKRFAFQFQALPKLMRAVAFKGRRAVAAIPAAQMFCKHMQFPKADGVSVAELVENAVPAALECPQHALVYRHVVVEGASCSGATSGAVGAANAAPLPGASGAKQEVICFAAARDMVGRIMQSCRDAKLELVGMQPEFFCTLKAFDNISRRADDLAAATLYIDIGAGATKILIAHAQTLVFAKSIQLGGLDLDKAVAHAIDRDLATAHDQRVAAVMAHKPRAALPADAPAQPRQVGAGAFGVAVAQDRRSNSTPAGLSGDLSQLPAEPVATGDFDLSECLEILEDEIAMCLRYYESIFPGQRVARAVFLGGESLSRGVCQHVARRIRLPAQLADPLARIARTGKEPLANTDFSIQQPGWAVAVGLSLLPTDL